MSSGHRGGKIIAIREWWEGEERKPFPAACSSCLEAKSSLVHFPDPNNAETMGRMTCHCFLRPIRRDLTSSSYTTLSRLFPPPIVHSVLPIFFFIVAFFWGGGGGGIPNGVSVEERDVYE